jgi:hypothetical protein
MTPDEAEWLRRAWGGRRCLHPTLDKEIIDGRWTDDYYCRQCGRHFFADEAEDILARQPGDSA